MVKSEPVSQVFAALADPTRRSMVEQLIAGPRTVGDLAAPLPMSLPAVSKHISVLERAGLVTRVRVGRSRTCRLQPERLAAAAGWFDAYREFWTARLDALESHLEETKHAHPSH
jgi:DNA-binding transcriptional ArsR family regulator